MKSVRNKGEILDRQWHILTWYLEEKHVRHEVGTPITMKMLFQEMRVHEIPMGMSVAREERETKGLSVCSSSVCMFLNLPPCSSFFICIMRHKDVVEIELMQHMETRRT